MENTFVLQVERFLQALLTVGRSPITAQEYRTHLAQLVAISGKSRLEDLTREDLEKFAWKHRQNGNYQQAVAAARSFLKWVYKAGLTGERNFADMLEPGKKPRRNPEDYVWLTFSEQRQLLQACQDDFERLVVTFFLKTGCRNGRASPRREFCGIIWSDIDFDRNVIKIHGKGPGYEGRIRYPHFDSTLKELLLAYMTALEQSRKGRKPLEDKRVFLFFKSPQEVVDLVRALATKAGLTRLAQTKHPVHALKHTFCTNWVIARLRGNKNENLRGLSDQVGTDIKTLEVYIHIAQEYHKASYEETMKLEEDLQ